MRQVFLSAAKAAQEYGDFFSKPPPIVDKELVDGQLDLLRNAISSFVAEEEPFEVPRILIDALNVRSNFLAQLEPDELAQCLIRRGDARLCTLHCWGSRSRVYLGEECEKRFFEEYSLTSRDIVEFMCAVTYSTLKQERSAFLLAVKFEEHFPFSEFVLSVLQGDDVAVSLLHILASAIVVLKEPARFYDALLLVAADGVLTPNCARILFKCLEHLATRVEFPVQHYIELHMQLSEFFGVSADRRAGFVRFVCQIVENCEMEHHEAAVLLQDVFMITKPTKAEVINIAAAVSHAIEMHKLETQFVLRFLRFLLSFLQASTVGQVGLNIVQSVACFFDDFAANEELVALFFERALSVFKALAKTPDKNQAEFYIHIVSLIKALAEREYIVSDIILDKMHLLFSLDAELDEMLDAFLNVGKE